MIPISRPIKDHLIRLKYLLEIQIDQFIGKNDEAEDILAIIMLDYCAEALLKTVLSASGGSMKPDAMFHETWDYVNDKIIKDPKFGIGISELPYKTDILNQRKVRNATQHANLIPSHSQAISSAAITRDFYVRVLADLAGEAYDALSLINLIKDKNAKALLEKAEDWHQKENWTESICCNAEALDHIVTIARWFYSSSLTSDINLTFMHSDISQVQDHATKKVFENIQKVLERIYETIGAQVHDLLGSDKKAYLRYRKITPYIQRTINGKVHFNIRASGYSKEESEFMHDYVLANILRLEGYGIEDLPEGTIHHVES